MSQESVELNFARIMPAVIGEMPVGLTLLDLEGRILYYNAYAAKVADRKPEYLGRDVRELHQPQSNDKIELILNEYKKGGKNEHHWQVIRDGLTVGVRVAPLVVGGRNVGLIHTIQVQGQSQDQEPA